MTKVRWIVSNDLGNQSDIEQLTKELENNDDIEYVPVSLEDVLTPSFKPDIPYDDIPTLFYGPVNFVSRMEKLGYKPGVFGTPDSYSYENLCKNIPHNLIFNSPEDSFVGNSQEIIDKLKETKDNQLFFKPFNDDKSVIGSVKDVKDIINFCSLVIQNKIPNVDTKTKFIVSTPYGIEKEYRLFVIDGKIVTGSEYKPNLSRQIPQNVVEFGDSIIKYWNPFPFFVLDIAISNNNCYVMEIQNFHSAGYYQSDIKKIINNINDFLKGKNE